MVQRYTYDQIFGFTPDVEGVLVLYEDYAKLEAELQKYKDQYPDYVECANCGSVTHVEGVEDAMGQSGCRKEDAKECEHVRNRYIVHPHRKICLVCGVKE